MVKAASYSLEMSFDDFRNGVESLGRGAWEGQGHKEWLGE